MKIKNDIFKRSNREKSNIAIANSLFDRTKIILRFGCTSIILSDYARENSDILWEVWFEHPRRTFGHKSPMHGKIYEIYKYIFISTFYAVKRILTVINNDLSIFKWFIFFFKIHHIYFEWHANLFTFNNYLFRCI